MRVAISGTHCCGKSTLIDAFLLGHRDYIYWSGGDMFCPPVERGKTSSSSTAVRAARICALCAKALNGRTL